MHAFKYIDMPADIDKLHESLLRLNGALKPEDRVKILFNYALVIKW